MYYPNFFPRLAKTGSFAILLCLMQLQQDFQISDSTAYCFANSSRIFSNLLLNSSIYIYIQQKVTLLVSTHFFRSSTSTTSSTFQKKYLGEFGKYIYIYACTTESKVLQNYFAMSITDRIPIVTYLFQFLSF